MLTIEQATTYRLAYDPDGTTYFHWVERYLPDRGDWFANHGFSDWIDAESWWRNVYSFY